MAGHNESEGTAAHGTLSLRGAHERTFGAILPSPTIGAPGLTHAGVQPNGVRLLLPFGTREAHRTCCDRSCRASSALGLFHREIPWSLITANCPISIANGHGR